MKTCAQIAVVDEMTPHLTLADPLAAALGLGDGSELKWVVLVPNESEHAWYEPDLTLIASTMPVRSWGRLMRGSFNLKPGPGSAAALINHMERLSLYVRHFQIEESVIATHHLRSPAGNRSFLCEANHPMVPTALLTFEIGGTPDELGTGMARTLLDAVQSVGNREKARHELDTALSQRLGDLAKQPLVNWLSPLGLLNALASEHDGSRSSANEPKAPRLSAHLQAASATVLHHTTDGLTSSLDPFRLDLWPWARERPTVLAGAQSLPIALVMTADSDERTLHIRCFRLFSSYTSQTKEPRVLVSFDLLIPSGGIESVWMRWLLDVIKADGGGTLLAAHTSARQQGRWVCTQITATFETWQHATRVMHRLQGADSCYCEDDPDWNILKSRLDSKEEDGDYGPSRSTIIQQCLPGRDHEIKRRHALEYRPQVYSLLSNVTVHGAAGPRSRRHYHNPFSFTRPLNLAEHNAIYGSANGTMSRLAIAENIVDVLTSPGGESVAIIGAQRTGKTSLLRMIEQLVDKRSLSDVHSGDQWLMVIVDAGTTPPQQLFLKIIEQLADKKNEILEKLRPNTLVSIPKAETIATGTAGGKELLTEALRTLSPVLGLPLRDKPSSGPPAEHIASHEIFETGLEHEIQRIELHIAALDPKSDEARARFMRTSLKALNLLMSTLHTRIIIAMDEVTDGSAWKGDWSFAVWRQQLEDEREYAPRWLFSSLQPLAEATSYPPLGNVAREINLPTLSLPEANGLFDRFRYQAAAAAPAEEPPAVLPADVRLKIVHLTGCHPYLMQVVLYHLWERVWYEAAPIVSSQLLDLVITARVLPELFDFFSYATRQLSAGQQPSDVLQTLRAGKALSSADQKVLERAGLLDARTKMPIQLLRLWVTENVP